MKKKHLGIQIALVAVPLVAVLTFLYFNGSLDTRQTSQAVGMMGGGWMGPDHGELPLATHSDVTSFLQEAEVVDAKRVGEGVNNPLKVTLEKDGVQLHAVFRDVKIVHNKIQIGNQLKFNFRDEARYELAAYQLALLLGIDNVPPTVECKYKGKEGTLQLWIEGAITEKKRLAENTRPEDIRAWVCQRDTMSLFDNLIFNEDRNQGNVLYDANWKMWMIDHTRSFRRHGKLPKPDSIRRCDRRMFETLKALDDETLKAQLKDCLSPMEIKGVAKRRRAIVEHIEALIQEQGENRVLFDMPAIG